MTPTQRSLDLLRKEGWTAAVVERWNPHARIRQDLFGFADLIAMRPGDPPLLVQTTSGGNMAARIAKILDEPLAALAATSGFTIEVHGWRKLKADKGRWSCRREPLWQPPPF